MLSVSKNLEKSSKEQLQHKNVQTYLYFSKSAQKSIENVQTLSLMT